MRTARRLRNRLLSPLARASLGGRQRRRRGRPASPDASPLYLLMLCNLVLGTGVFVAGILASVAESLQVGVGAAGER